MQNNLPKRHSSHIIDDEAVRKLGSIFEESRFRWCSHEIRDYGVDATIELITGDNNTSNYRFQVQLKSIYKTILNADNSISHNIETSNFNYLIRYPVSIYILYAKDIDRFFIEDAQDKLKEFERLSKDWQNNKYITIRFKKLLDKNSLDEIYRYVYQWWDAYRKVKINFIPMPTKDLIENLGIITHQSNDALINKIHSGIKYGNNMVRKVINNKRAIIPLYSEKGIPYIDADILSPTFLDNDKLNIISYPYAVRCYINFTSFKTFIPERYIKLLKLKPIAKYDINRDVSKIVPLDNYLYQLLLYVNLDINNKVERNMFPLMAAAVTNKEIDNKIILGLQFLQMFDLNYYGKTGKMILKLNLLDLY